jgi:aminoglycoside phosphotransferase
MIQTVLDRSSVFGRLPEIDGKIKWLDTGLNHRNYIFWVKSEETAANEDPDTLPAYLLRIPLDDDSKNSSDDPIEKLRREARTLQILEKCSLPFEVPKFIGFTGEDKVTGLIETLVPAVSLKYHEKSTDHALFEIMTIAQAAATIHRLPMELFSHLPRYADSRQHVLTELKEIPPDFFDEDAEARIARDWILDHLTKDRPAVLLHGDLLAQNVLWDRLSNCVGVVDWEYAKFGDPAYDLAIVTRGHAKLFGCPNGLGKLLNSYLEFGGIPITKNDVINHELLLYLHLHWRMLRDYHAGKRAYISQEYRNQLLTVLRRIS